MLGLVRNVVCLFLSLSYISIDFFSELLIYDVMIVDDLVLCLLVIKCYLCNLQRFHIVARFKIYNVICGK